MIPFLPTPRDKLRFVEKELYELAQIYISDDESERIMLARAHILDALDLMPEDQRKPEIFKGKTKSEIRAIILRSKTKKGGWTRATLEQWDVPWPPPKGWKENLIENGEDDKLS